MKETGLCLWQHKAEPNQVIQLHRLNCREVEMPMKDCNIYVEGKKMLCNTDEMVTVQFDKKIVLETIFAEGTSSWREDAGQAKFIVQGSDDGENWVTYTKQTDEMTGSSYCYEGRCAETRTMQCKDLWGPGASSAEQVCYDKLNTCADCGNKTYGTCDAARMTSCQPEDVMCGQLQCSSSLTTPIFDYAESYTEVQVEGETCNAAALSWTADSIGPGMVADGTKCGDSKMCIGNKCQSFADLGLKACPVVDGTECAGRGVCTEKGVCSCDSGYDPTTHCASALSVVNGNWGPWSEWSACDKACGGGTQIRYRFCDDPAPANQGTFCTGDRIKTRQCGTETCPDARSCRHLQSIGVEKGITFPDGIYTINPGGKGPIKTFCDMSQNGGGWTLVVSSHSNKWTESEISLRNENRPLLTDNYSILSRADDIKDSSCKNGAFEYRLEAQHRGCWGGIWSAPCEYSFVSTSPFQTNVTLVEQFDSWTFEPLTSRMPYINQTFLTTNTWITEKNKLGVGGSIISTSEDFNPAPWITSLNSERVPLYIWYWVREEM